MPRAVGDFVQTPLGKGIVREIRNGGRLLIDVSGRAVLFDPDIVTPVDSRSRSLARPRARSSVHEKKRASPPPEFVPSAASSVARQTRGEVDLHGLTVEEALSCAERAINDALLDDRLQLLLIHGQSGGRIRAALHRRLGEITAVRGFHLDPRNPGVTVVSF